MKELLLKYFILLLVLSGCDIQDNHPSSQLITCGQQEVAIIKFDNSSDTAYQKVWSWRASDFIDSTDCLYQIFYAMDECKSVNKGKQILITASWRGGVVLIDRKTKDILFYAILPNAHSAEMLPGNRIVVAASTAEGGNCLALYDIEESNKILFNDSLYSGHGVIWDEDRELLWALGYDDLRAYKLKNWESDSPSFELMDAYKIPGMSGHDLQDFPDSDNLFITEEGSVWVFNRETKVFSEFEDLAGKEHVKSIMINPVTKQLVYVQADTAKSSSEFVRFLNPDKKISIKGQYFYKARWVTD